MINLKKKMTKRHKKILEKAIELLKKTPEVHTIALNGSAATGKLTPYSDIDIDVVIKDKEYASFLKKLPPILSSLGEIQLMNKYGGSDEVYAYFGKEYLKVEIDPLRYSEIKPNYFIKDYKIVYAKDNVLKEAVRRSQKIKPVKIDEKIFVWFLKDTRSNLIYVAEHVAKKQLYSAFSDCISLHYGLFLKLGELRGYRDYEFVRRAEKILTKKEKGYLKKSLPGTVTKKEIRQAIFTDLELVQYLEKEFEKEMAREINLGIDDKGIRKHIERLTK